MSQPEGKRCQQCGGWLSLDSQPVCASCRYEQQREEQLLAVESEREPLTSEGDDEQGDN